MPVGYLSKAFTAVRSPIDRGNMSNCSVCDICIAPISNAYEELGVCHQCADIIANLYWKKHTGEYLTWPNETRDHYRKKKIDFKLRWAVFKRDQFKCVSCQIQDDLSADHIIPESKGGMAVFDNLQTLCRSYNSCKGAL